MKIIAIICMTLCLIGCKPESPSESWKGVARILPIIVVNSEGETHWTKERISRGFTWANESWSNSGIQLKMLDPEPMVDDNLYNQTSMIEFTKIMRLSRKIAKERNVYPIFFVNEIKWGDNIYGGMSTSADAPLGFNYGTMVSAGGGRTISHELGHAWNLRHTWSDKHDDTTGKDSSDCNASIKCNVMSYCFVSDCSVGSLFSPDQIVEMRRWSLSSGRIHVIETDGAVTQTVLPLLSEPEITLDPVFGS